MLMLRGSRKAFLYWAAQNLRHISYKDIRRILDRDPIWEKAALASERDVIFTTLIDHYHKLLTENPVGKNRNLWDHLKD